MATFIKRVPKFEARAYTGLGAVAELAQLAGGGFRIESQGHLPAILFLKTNRLAGRIVEDSDIRMEVGQVLVRDESGTLTMMSGEDFALQYEVAP